jgi:hypothetical protein
MTAPHARTAAYDFVYALRAVPSKGMTAGAVRRIDSHRWDPTSSEEYVCCRSDSFVPATQETQARTRAFARVTGPWLAIVPSIIMLRVSEMGALAAEFFENGLFVWFAGALLLFVGLLIIAFHQYWTSVAAVIISLFGWILALRGLLLMAAPEVYERAATAMDTILFVRLIFGVLVAIGLYLTYVGWLAEPARRR